MQLLLCVHSNKKLATRDGRKYSIAKPRNIFEIRDIYFANRAKTKINQLVQKKCASLSSQLLFTVSYKSSDTDDNDD